MGVKNGIFWSEIGSGYGEPGGTLPPRIPRSNPSLPLQGFLYDGKKGHNFTFVLIPVSIVN